MPLKKTVDLQPTMVIEIEELQLRLISIEPCAGKYRLKFHYEPTKDFFHYIGSANTEWEVIEDPMIPVEAGTVYVVRSQDPIAHEGEDGLESVWYDEQDAEDRAMQLNEEEEKNNSHRSVRTHYYTEEWTVMEMRR